MEPGVMADKGSISVIVPTYNAAEFLTDSLSCIENQNCRDLEIIVVDDGSSDDSARVVANFPRVRYVRQHNQGPAAARNKGLSLAHGNMVAFLDADDLWPANTLKTLWEHLATHAQTDVVLGRVQCMRLVVGSGERRFEPFSEPCVAFNVGAALYRRSVFDKVRLFDPSMRSGEDIDWFMRAREAGAVIEVLEQVTLLYRLHDHNMTLARDTTYSYLARALKKSIDRRRNAGTPTSLDNILGTNRV
jgi:glycosyltransferase involved in cell wall biosynthesis